MKNKYLLKMTKFLASIPDREIAVISLMFPLAFSAEFILSRLQHQGISGQAIFGFWYLLIALRFSTLYPVSLFLAAVVIIFSGLWQSFNSNFSTQFGATASFGLIVLAVIQLIILQWQEKQASR